MNVVDNAGRGAAGGRGLGGGRGGRGGRPSKTTCKTLERLPGAWCPSCRRKKGEVCAFASGASDLAGGAAAAGLPAGGAAAASFEADASVAPDVQGRHQRLRSADWAEGPYAPPTGSLRDRGGRSEQLRGAYAAEDRIDSQPLANLSALLRSQSAGCLGAAEASRALPALPGPPQPLALPATTPEAGPARWLVRSDISRNSDRRVRWRGACAPCCPLKPRRHPR